MSTTNEHGRRNGQRPLRGVFLDSAYATIGLGGATVEAVRSIDRLRTARDRGVASVRLLIDQGVATGRGLPGLAGREFDGLAQRGRELVGAIRASEATSEAVHRTRTARSRVKAAGTSVGRAYEGAVQAAEQAATIVAGSTTPPRARKAPAKSATAPAGTHRARPRPSARTRQATPRSRRAT
ncbi:MAG TPA: hypothetical protein VHM23_08345 [Actinomycetota bacterium]|jgi:hypothetical protein|nr:hypothetical protein [Actinomycetota bacterium]